MELIDMHCDTMSALLHSGRKQSLAQNDLCVDIEGMYKAGTWIQFFACFVDAFKFQKKPSFDIVSMSWEDAWREVLQLLEQLRKEESQDLQMIRTCADAEKNREMGRLCALATVEEGGVLNEKMERLEELYESGVRLLTLTWNYENCLGYPNSVDADIMKCGLKSFGMEVIERMNELGMLIDVSHLSDGGFWDCIQKSKVPIVASHSNVRALCTHPRNLSDDMLRALAEKGGVAGLNFYPAFLKEDSQVTVADLARHVKHMIHVAGEDVVAIGTDFDGFESTVTKGYISHIREMERVWETCRKEGITESQLDKICWQNAWRVMQEVLHCE